ncbi:polymeric immunoglobulin receptor-like [Misgurnus anguillicaudatus]|uniref:polymeric immunoglobulin receptor-like n=1 Tax=Misgurnus anguillicaudatus TaxID=75329 RepID=UPI003CCF4779
MAKKAKKRNFADTEMEVLVDEVESNQHRSFGSLSVGGITNKRKHSVWEHVTSAVNSVGSEERTVPEIKKKCRIARIIGDTALSGIIRDGDTDAFVPEQAGPSNTQTQGPECFLDGSYSIGTRHLSVKSGGSVTIPCYYNRKYTQQQKHWYSEIYKSSIYTNTTQKNVSVIDHPDQSLFTVTIRDLQDQNTGYYWCAVQNEEDKAVTKWYKITIQAAPDLSVMSSSVTVDEGGNISLQCLYTSTYKNKTKQWCRYKDKGCYTVGRSDTSQNASVKISDDGRGSLTVVMFRLMKSDSGWYYCHVGDLQVPVLLSVTGKTHVFPFDMFHFA